MELKQQMTSAFIGVAADLPEMRDAQVLEGVITHEAGHIIHRGIIGAYSGRSRRNRDRDNGGGGAAVAVLLLVALLVRPLVMIIGTLLQLGISRKREYAADAVAVRLCSYNEGLARALEKLGGKKYSADDIKEPGGENMACMYINFPGENFFPPTRP